MTDHFSSLHFGIVEFAEPTLLLVGDARSLKCLAAHIAERRDVQFSREQWTGHPVGSDVDLIPVEQQGRLVLSDSTVKWEISEQEAIRFSRLLEKLAETPSPAHAYLDSEEKFASIHVVASKGEYDPRTVFRVSVASESGSHALNELGKRADGP